MLFGLSTVLCGLLGGGARRVAAPDGLKNETFWTDLRILINHAAEHTTATTAAIVIGMTISDAAEQPHRARRAPERRKC